MGDFHMATMNISLPEEMVEFVEREVASGGYTSSSEVVREALRLLRHDKELEAGKLAILKRAVSLGIADADAGRFSGKTAPAALRCGLRHGGGRQLCPTDSAATKKNRRSRRGRKLAASGKPT